MPVSDPRERAFHKPSDDQNPEATDDPAAEQEKALGEPTAISAASMAAKPCAFRTMLARGFPVNGR